MADEPEQPATTEPPDPRSFFDTLPYPHREALLGGVAWVVDQALDAVADTRRGAQPRHTLLVMDHLPPRWRGRYDRRFLWQFAVCAVTVAHKLRTWPPTDGYMTSCLAEEIALRLMVDHAETLMELAADERGERWEDDFMLDSVLEYASTDRNHDVLWYTGEHRWTEKELASVGPWKTDLRYRSLFRHFGFDPLPPVHPLVDPEPDWWKQSPEPPPDEEPSSTTST